MSGDATRELVQREIGLITTPLYESIAAGVADAKARLRGVDRLDENPHLVPMVARTQINNYLRADTPQGWDVAGDTRLMGQTSIINGAHNIELRLLKENGRVHPGGTPPAGHNQARRGYYTNDELALFSARDLTPDRFDPDTAIRLLWLWDRSIVDDVDAITVRVVHPLSAARYGVYVPSDFSFDILPGGDMHTHLHFPGDSSVEDFFPRINKEENGDNGMAV